MMPAHPVKPAEQVASYYDANTRRFLRFGGSGATAAIHRQIWAPGVETVEQAFVYLNQMVADAVQPVLPLLASPRLLDLGCGVGGTATWLAERLGVTVVGVTNSAVQQVHAEERARRLGLGLADRCQFLLADFMSLPPVGPLNAAYAIESFVHAPDALRFFSQINSQLISGGRLVICDDFLAEPRATPDGEAERWLARFQRDWQINTLLSLNVVREMAQRLGFRLLQATDLSAYLRSLHPLVLRLIARLTQMPLRSAYWRNLSGGAALQMCVSRGWTRYLILIFEKEAECTSSQ
jgi:cyclopropane fatty-acyl-phospholipid synthase-like methyltransferase